MNFVCFLGEFFMDFIFIDEVGEEEFVDFKICLIILGREIIIEIEKGRTGLGLSIVGGVDIFLVSGMGFY